MGNRFNVVRVSSPNFSSLTNEELLFKQKLSQQILGDQLDFGWSLPSAFRALANPLTPVVFPKKPDKRKDFFGAIAYWHSLQWLLIYRLGWAHPGKGIAELLPQLMNPHIELDDTLELVREVWFEDGCLEHYLSWAQSQYESFLLRRPYVHEIDFYQDPLDIPEEFERHSPHGLHLEFGAYHYFIDFVADFEKPKFSVDGHNETAIVVIDSAWGWYDVLCEVAETQQWLNYDVHVESFGFMGRYHFSRETGLCYTGSHEVHLLGNIRRD